MGPDRTAPGAQHRLERLGYRVAARQFRERDLIVGRSPQVIAGEVGTAVGSELESASASDPGM